MIAGHQKFFVSVRRNEYRVFRIVSAAGKKLQCQERMRSSAFPEVDLDRIGLPGRGVLRTSDDEVDRETADNAGISQKLADFCSVLSNGDGVSRISWKDTAEVALSGRAA